MKKMIQIAVGLIVVLIVTNVAVKLMFRATKPAPYPKVNATALSRPASSNEQTPRTATTRRIQPDGSLRATTSTAAANASSAASTEAMMIKQTVAALADSLTPYSDKQALWGQLRDKGHLDAAITELEARLNENPSDAGVSAALGQAYLQKAGTIKEITDQGILGLKADKTFDAALAADGSNWEARFWKASAMTYWPPQLGKTTEMLQHFCTLIEQQEAQPPRPEFAQTYLTLGEQYEKNGYADYAKQIWARGGALFPQDGAFKDRLAKLNP